MFVPERLPPRPPGSPPKNIIPIPMFKNAPAVPKFVPPPAPKKQPKMLVPKNPAFKGKNLFGFPPKGQGNKADKQAEDAEKGIKYSVGLIGKATDKIVPGSSKVLDFLGNMLSSNVSKIIKQKDESRRTKQMIKHYNVVKGIKELAPMTRARMLNVIRQMYNKNISDAEREEFKRQYNEFLLDDAEQWRRLAKDKPAIPQARLDQLSSMLASAGKGIHGGARAQAKKAKKKASSRVQSVVFPKDEWTKDEAMKWLSDHMFKYEKVDKEPNTLRYRQADPYKFARFATKVVDSDGRPVNLVIGFKK